MVALGKEPGPQWMSEENLFHNPEAAAIAGKITMEVDPGAEEAFFQENGLAIPSHVEIRTVDGKVYREEVIYSKGTPNNSFEKGDLQEKFRNLSSSLLSEKQVVEIMAAVEALDRMEDISQLTALLKQEGSA